MKKTKQFHSGICYFVATFVNILLVLKLLQHVRERTFSLLVLLGDSGRLKIVSTFITAPGQRSGRIAD